MTAKKKSRKAGKGNGKKAAKAKASKKPARNLSREQTEKAAERAPAPEQTTHEALQGDANPPTLPLGRTETTEHMTETADHAGDPQTEPGLDSPSDDVPDEDEEEQTI